MFSIGTSTSKTIEGIYIYIYRNIEGKYRGEGEGRIRTLNLTADRVGSGNAYRRRHHFSRVHPFRSAYGYCRYCRRNWWISRSIRGDGKCAQRGESQRGFLSAARQTTAKLDDRRRWINSGFSGKLGHGPRGIPSRADLSSRLKHGGDESEKEDWFLFSRVLSRERKNVSQRRTWSIQSCFQPF